MKATKLMMLSLNSDETLVKMKMVMSTVMNLQAGTSRFENMMIIVKRSVC